MVWQDKDVAESACAVLRLFHRLGLLIPTAGSAFSNQAERLFWQVFLLLAAALPGMVNAQTADQVRSVQNIFEPVAGGFRQMGDTGAAAADS